MIGYTTEDEITFLRGIGNYTDEIGNPRDLLERYRTAMPLRANWGDIDQNVIRATVNRLLSQT